MYFVFSGFNETDISYIQKAICPACLDGGISGCTVSSVHADR